MSDRIDATATDEHRRDLVACISAFLGLGAIGLIDQLGLPGFDPVFLVGSLGASAILLFGAPDSPMSQPKSVILGHFLSALIGVSCHQVLGDTPWLAGSLAVALSLVAMRRTGTLHAPGGASALIANIGTERVTDLGYGYAFAPVLVGAIVLVAVAWVVRHGPAWMWRGLRRLSATGEIEAESLAK